jgi:hypothetical protein
MILGKKTTGVDGIAIVPTNSEMGKLSEYVYVKIVKDLSDPNIHSNFVKYPKTRAL